VERRLDAAERAGMSSEMLYTIDPEHKIWSKDRLAQRGRLTEDMYHASDDVPGDGRAVIAGGIAGAGKTTVLENFAGIDRSHYLTVNPDKIKEKMAERRMIPHVDGLAPMERSGLVHEESSQAASDLATRAYADRRNVIWDITMSRIESALKRIDNLREAGYTEVVGVFVDIPAEKSVERAASRHRHGLEDYRNGRGHGGRFLAPDLIWRQQTADGQTLNRKVFESLKPYFDRWMIFDNSVDGRSPVLVEAGGREREKV
jgi:predicted ABC-type ATPase